MPAALSESTIQERVDRMCEMVVEGKTLRQIAKDMKCSAGALLRYVAESPYSEQYARARDAAAELFEADILTAALAVTPETAQAERVKIDALKWIAARRAPKRYGDRIQNEVSGDLTISVITGVPDPDNGSSS